MPIAFLITKSVQNKMTFFGKTQLCPFSDLRCKIKSCKSSRIELAWQGWFSKGSQCSHKPHMRVFQALENKDFAPHASGCIPVSYVIVYIFGVPVRFPDTSLLQLLWEHRVLIAEFHLNPTSGSEGYKYLWNPLIHPERSSTCLCLCLCMLRYLFSRPPTDNIYLFSRFCNLVKYFTEINICPLFTLFFLPVTWLLLSFFEFLIHINFSV